MAKQVATEDLQVQTLLAKIVESGQQVVVGGEFEVEALPTGISSFDVSTGIGGLPRGRVVLIEGEEGSGKTLLALATIAQVQRTGGRAAFIDLEHALTPDFARLLGVDYEKLILSRPRTLNDAYDVARPLAESGLFDVIVFDSAVALAPKDAIEKSASAGNQRATEAQLHSQELKKLVSSISERTVFIIVNQLREDPNPAPWARGKQLYSPGGRALKHASSLTVRVSIGERYEKNKVRIGQLTKTYIVKNKVASPFRRAEFKLMYEGGLDLTSSTIDTCLELGIIRKESSFFILDLFDLESGELIEEFKFHGRVKLEEAIESDERILPALEAYMAQTLNEEGDGDD